MQQTRCCLTDSIKGRCLWLCKPLAQLLTCILFCCNRWRAGIEQLPEEDVFLLDDSPQPQMSKPGCYRGVCVALKLHHLAVAAVDMAPQLAELSGALTLEGLLGPAAPTFKVLRDLVQVRTRTALLGHVCAYLLVL